MSSSAPKTGKMILLASLGLLIPIFLVGMAYLAVKSDEANQQEYEQIKLRNLERIQQRDAEAAKQQAMLEVASEAKAP